MSDYLTWLKKIKSVRGVSEFLYYSKRLNQIVLCFPLWVTLGASRLLAREDSKEGWKKSESSEKPEKMY